MSSGTPGTGAVAYVLKGFPVLSETFISSEVHRVERAGIRLRLYVIKPPDPGEHHPVVDRIRARPEYLPPTTRIGQSSGLRWLVTNVPRFVPSLARTLRRRPRGVLAATRLAVGESVLARGSTQSWPKSWPNLGYVRDLLVALALADRVLDDPDVRHLHAHFAHDTTTVTWLASMITGLPFSFTAHAKDIYATRLNPRDLLRRKLHAATFVVTCTGANQSHLRQRADGTPVHLVYHGLNDDFQRFARLDGADPPPTGAIRLLAAGRLVRKKGFDVFVEACALLRRRGVPFEAVVAGEDDAVGDGGSVREDLTRRTARHGLGDSVRMPGMLGQAELHAAYRRADVFCLPCRVLDDGDRDGIPNVLLEAMSCGVPVVTTPVSGIPELVEDGTNGLLVPPDDAAALADAVETLHADPALARRLGEAGRATVRERFDGDILAGQLATLFGEVVQ